MMEPMQFLGVMQQELEHQRQLLELMQQMQQQMRQMQHQEQQAREAQTQQGAPPSGGNERQIMKGFDEIEVFPGGEEQWQKWSWKIKTAVSGMNEEFAEMLTTAEAKGIESIEGVLREAKFVDANRERCVKAGKELYGVLARYTNSEAFDDREERIGDGRSKSMGEVTCELQQKNVGANVQSATRVHVSEACEGCWSSAIGNHAMGGEVEGDDV